MSEVIGNRLNVADINHIRVMARIKQVGIGRMASGTIDGITYVTRGLTTSRSMPSKAKALLLSPVYKRFGKIIHNRIL